MSGCDINIRTLVGLSAKPSSDVDLDYVAHLGWVCFQIRKDPLQSRHEVFVRMLNRDIPQAMCRRMVTIGRAVEVGWEENLENLPDVLVAIEAGMQPEG